MHNVIGHDAETISPCQADTSDLTSGATERNIMSVLSALIMTVLITVVVLTGLFIGDFVIPIVGDKLHNRRVKREMDNAIRRLRDPSVENSANAYDKTLEHYTKKLVKRGVVNVDTQA